MQTIKHTHAEISPHASRQPPNPFFISWGVGARWGAYIRTSLDKITTLWVLVRASRSQKQLFCLSKDKFWRKLNFLKMADIYLILVFICTLKKTVRKKLIAFLRTMIFYKLSQCKTSRLNRLFNEQWRTFTHQIHFQYIRMVSSRRRMDFLKKLLRGCIELDICSCSSR